MKALAQFLAPRTALAATALALTGCISIKTHSSFEPIYMTLDVNLKVQLQEELSDVFGDIDAASSSLSL
ncbi:MAG: hypothetical protein CBD18_08470 [Opitutales bacterium TMED158]|nr:MAG: hypothetical protein CBD18_08470 [Opitutales bacterium TMED158]